jgi:primosomal protein N' (replication factor Y)
VIERATGNRDALGAPEPTAHQQRAIAAVRASLGTFRCFLLYGVTGSGKTEVYLRLASEVISSGRQVLVLVPEISLTPQLVERFRSRLAAPVVVLHSSLSDGDRLAAWRAARDGRAGVVLGHAPRCSRHCARRASSSWTRSTILRSSSRKAFVTTRATSR